MKKVSSFFFSFHFTDNDISITILKEIAKLNCGQKLSLRQTNLYVRVLKKSETNMLETSAQNKCEGRKKAHKLPPLGTAVAPSKTLSLDDGY